MQVYTVAYNCWISCIGDTSVSERLQEDFHAEERRREYVYRQVDATTAFLVCNYCTVPKADDVEATLSTHVPDDVKLYHSSALRNERDDELLS